MTDSGTQTVSIRMERIGELSWLVYVGDIPQSILYVTEEELKRLDRAEDV